MNGKRAEKCKKFWKKGYCEFGKKCMFKHAQNIHVMKRSYYIMGLRMYGKLDYKRLSVFSGFV